MEEALFKECLTQKNNLCAAHVGKRCLPQFSTWEYNRLPTSF
jgi:hypothetical protein